MKWLNGYRMSLVLIGFVAAVVPGGGSAKADFTFGTPAKADFTFGTPVKLAPNVNSTSNEDGLTISADGLSLFFASDRLGHWDLYMATRETTEDEWDPAMNLGTTVNSPQNEWYPSISPDGLELYFCSHYWFSRRPGGFGGGDLWVTRRASISDGWNEPENLGPVVNSASIESEPSISADGFLLYFSSDRAGGEGICDLYVTTRFTKDDDWSMPINLGPVVNSVDDDMNPCISVDGLALFFRSPRPGGYGRSDIYLTTRATTSDPWGEPVNLGLIINNSSTQVSHYISPDGSTLYLDPVDSFDLWQVEIIPIVDFNSDGIVDAADMCIMVDNWGTDEPLCDIGPMPWGDGIVDVQDLIVLAEHLFEEFPPAE
jgi:Tol biopolymer transport system component